MCSQFKSNAKLAFIRICKVCLRKYRCNNLTTMDNVGFTQICIHIYRTVNRCGNFYIFIQRKIGICLYGYLVIIGTVVAKWERIYLEEGKEGFYIERRGRKSTGRPAKIKKKVEEDLIAEVQRLRADNAYLKKLNALVSERVRQEKKHK